MARQIRETGFHSTEPEILKFKIGCFALPRLPQEPGCWKEQRENDRLM